MARAKSSPAPPHNTFILAEDEAVKLMLEKTVTLPDGNGVEQPVRVWFRWPDPETQITYPFVTIDLVGIEPYQDVWESEYRLYRDSFEDEANGLPTGDKRIYDPSTIDSIDMTNRPYYFHRRNYLAYHLYYQLNLWANNAWHDRMLSARMFRDIVMPHPSWLHCPADRTWKRMETINWAAADLPSQDGASKRIFRKIYTISVQTEIPQDKLSDLSQQPEIQRLLVRGSFMGSDGAYWTADEVPDHWEIYHQR